MQGHNPETRRTGDANDPTCHPYYETNLLLPVSPENDLPCQRVGILRPAPNFIAAQTLHVVPGKDTGGSGTLDDPFRDPHQALAAADKLRKSSDAPEVAVVFGGGTYHLDKPLAPGAGNPSERPLILRPAPGKRVVFSMGTPVRSPPSLR
jgi:hypothetical protein